MVKFILYSTLKSVFILLGLIVDSALNGKLKAFLKHLNFPKFLTGLIISGAAKEH